MKCYLVSIMSVGDDAIESIIKNREEFEAPNVNSLMAGLSHFYGERITEELRDEKFIQINVKLLKKSVC